MGDPEYAKRCRGTWGKTDLKKKKKKTIYTHDTAQLCFRLHGQYFGLPYQKRRSPINGLPGGPDGPAWRQLYNNVTCKASQKKKKLVMRRVFQLAVEARGFTLHINL